MDLRKAYSLLFKLSPDLTMPIGVCLSPVASVVLRADGRCVLFNCHREI